MIDGPRGSQSGNQGQETDTGAGRSVDGEMTSHPTQAILGWIKLAQKRQKCGKSIKSGWTQAGEKVRNNAFPKCHQE